MRTMRSSDVIAGHNVGDTVTLVIDRGGKEITLQVTLGGGQAKMTSWLFPPPCHAAGGMPFRIPRISNGH